MKPAKTRRSFQGVLLGLTLALTLAIWLTPQASAAAACCKITAIDPHTGVVTARQDASGQTFQFAASPAVLRTLRLGQGVYANLRSRQVSIDGRSACCNIVSIGAASNTLPPSLGNSRGPVQIAPVDGYRPGTKIAPVDGVRAGNQIAPVDGLKAGTQIAPVDGYRPGTKIAPVDGVRAGNQIAPVDGDRMDVVRPSVSGSGFPKQNASGTITNISGTSVHAQVGNSSSQILVLPHDAAIRGKSGWRPPHGHDRRRVEHRQN